MNTGLIERHKEHSLKAENLELGPEVDSEHNKIAKVEIKLPTKHSTKKIQVI